MQGGPFSRVAHSAQWLVSRGALLNTISKNESESLLPAEKENPELSCIES